MRRLEPLVARGVALRARYRGLTLPFFALPLVPAALVYLLANDARGVMGCVAGLGFTFLAAKVLRRGRHGDIRRASWLMAVGTGLAAALAARMAMPLPLLMAALAGYGTRLLYAEIPEAAPEVVVVERPPPAPAPMPVAPGPLDEARARLQRIEGAARWLQDRHLLATCAAMAGVLDELAPRPERLPVARRFLAVHLDGLERIAERLQAGATPPATLAPLLDDLARTAGELRERIRREESEALEIQVKVLADRLKQEGFA